MVVVVAAVVEASVATAVIAAAAETAVVVIATVAVVAIAAVRAGEKTAPSRNRASVENKSPVLRAVGRKKADDPGMRGSPFFHATLFD